MMRRIARLVLLPLLAASSAAQAGAWTQARGKWQIITGAVASAADNTFGSTAPIFFRRALLQNYVEYGLYDRITLIAATESAYVDVAQNGGTPFHAVDNAFAAGARIRLDRLLGMDASNVFSIEGSWRVAGAFNFAVSANRTTGGNGEELRLLYGRNFQLGGRYGYFDIQLGHNFLSGGRPDETPLDLTAGWWIGQNHLLMVQSFNLFSGAGATPAFPAFNSHKVELSWVWKRSARTLWQFGAFFSPFGNNALKENGFSFSLWRRF
jgi:hypothetical protein